MAEEKKPQTKLHEWLDRHQHKQSWLADYLGIKRQSVNAWVMGKTRPDPKYAYAIVDLAGGELTLEDLLPRAAGARGSHAPARMAAQTLPSVA